MRQVSRRFRARLVDPNRWVTEVDWSNDGFRTVNAATFVSGTVTASSTAQIRWQCGLVLDDVPVGLQGLNGLTSQIRIRHGMFGEPLLPMGVYKATSVSTTDGTTQVQVSGASREIYLQRARFVTSRTFYPQSAQSLILRLIRDVFPSAQMTWLLDDDPQMPKIIEPRDRWPLIDGDREAKSIAKSIGARVFASPTGDWITAPVPALTDPAVWTAERGEVLLSASEELSDEGVYNAVVVNGQAADAGTPPFKAGVAQDTDPFSPTYAGKSPESGGFGLVPRFYTSQFIRNTAQAQKSAQGQLAPLLGLKQKVSFATLHDPTKEPGDVGIVQTDRGDRRVILDSVTYDLLGGPLSADTRTTETRLAGDVTDTATEGDEGE